MALIDPNIALSYRPTNLGMPDPLAVQTQQANLTSIANNQQLQQGQIAMQPGALEAQSQENQQRALELKNQADTNKAVQANITTDPATGKVSINHDGIVQALAQAGNGVAAMTYQKNATAFQTGLNALAESINKLQIAHRDNLASVAASILDAPPETRATLYPIAVRNAIANHQVNPGELPAQYDPSFDPQLQQLRQNSEAQSKLDSAAKTATGAAQRGTAALQTSDREKAQADQQNAAIALGNAKTQPDYAAVWEKLPAGIARKFPLPEAWTPDTPAAALKVGMSPDQQVTANAAAVRDANTARHQNVLEAQGAARVRIEQQNADYAQRGGGAINDPTYMAGIVRGEININPRDKNFAAVSAAAKALDPSWTSDRYSNRQHATQSFTSGPDSKTLESFNQVTSHLGELAAASAAMGTNMMQYTPGVVANLSPTVKKYNDAADTAGAELATTLAKGQATQGEVERTMTNLRSGNPEARAAGLQQYTALIGGRMRALAKKYAASTGDVFPVDQYIDSDAVSQLQKNGVDPYAIAQAEAPSWMRAKHMPVGGVPAAAPAAGPPAAGAIPAAPPKPQKLFGAFKEIGYGPNGQQIGSNDGQKTWYDLTTGKRYQP